MRLFTVKAEYLRDALTILHTALKCAASNLNVAISNGNAYKFTLTVIQGCTSHKSRPAATLATLE